MLFNKIIDQTIKKVFLSDDSKCLKLECESGMNFFIICNDDGGSTGNDDKSWINHISGVKALIGKKVTGCRVNPLDHEEELFDLNNVSLSVQISSLGGYCDIEFRNQNNGYYGGKVYFSLEGYHTDFTELTKDF